MSQHKNRGIRNESKIGSHFRHNLCNKTDDIFWYPGYNRTVAWTVLCPQSFHHYRYLQHRNWSNKSSLCLAKTYIALCKLLPFYIVNCTRDVFQIDSHCHYSLHKWTLRIFPSDCWNNSSVLLSYMNLGPNLASHMDLGPILAGICLFLFQTNSSSSFYLNLDREKIFKILLIKTIKWLSNRHFRHPKQLIFAHHCRILSHIAQSFRSYSRFHRSHYR